MHGSRRRGISGYGGVVGRGGILGYGGVVGHGGEGAAAAHDASVGVVDVGVCGRGCSGNAAREVASEILTRWPEVPSVFPASEWRSVA